MKSSSSYFVVQDVNKADNGKLNVAGQFIINGNLELDSPSTSQSEAQEPKVKLELPRLFEVKWILPPGGWAYGAVKGAAESMGYETVEHDDFSYPER